MSNDSDWFFGLLSAIVALVGLFLAARASDLGMSLFGYGLLIFGALFTYWSIKRHFDRKEGREA